MKTPPEASCSRPETITEEFGGTNGAAYVPVESTVPLTASPPTTPFTVHVTGPTKSELNVRYWPVVNVADDGLRLRITGEVLGACAPWPDVEIADFGDDPHPMLRTLAANNPIVRSLGLSMRFEGYTLLLYGSVGQRRQLTCMLGYLPSAVDPRHR
jgi:hypothetical protein